MFETITQVFIFLHIVSIFICIFVAPVVVKYHKDTAWHKRKQYKMYALMPVYNIVLASRVMRKYSQNKQAAQKARSVPESGGSK